MVFSSKRSHAKQIAVILTDAGLALDPMRTLQAAKDAADDGIAVHVVGTSLCRFCRPLFAGCVGIGRDLLEYAHVTSCTDIDIVFLFFSIFMNV